jgi:hypothetical protein
LDAFLQRLVSCDVGKFKIAHNSSTGPLILKWMQLLPENSEL